MSRAYFEHFKKILAELEAVPDRGVHFWFADLQEFNCSACGQCCKLSWTIHVNRDYYENWEKELGPKLGIPTEAVFELIPQGGREQYAALRKQPNSNRCVLLDERDLCRAHAAMGSEAKPFVCQSYPHTSTRLPWLQYGASFLSPSCHKIGRDQPKSFPLRHKFFAIPPNAPLPKMTVTSRHQLNFGGLMLWNGIQLDLLDRCGSFGAWLAGTTTYITHLIRMTESELGQAELTHLPWPLEAHHPVKMSLAERAQILLNLLPPLSTRPVLAGWIPMLESWARGQEPVPFSPEEEALLWYHQHFYWQRQILAQDWLLGGRLDLLRQQVLWAIAGLLMRLGAILYRQLDGTTLTPEHIGKATNMVQAYVMQNSSAPQLWKLDGLRPEACLVLLSRIANWSES